jgi:asparagine synthase (glutamine-hydrolysing)
MSQLAGVFSHDGNEITDKLTAMLGTFHSQDAVKANFQTGEHPWLVSSSFENIAGNTALAELFSPIDIKNLEYPYLDYVDNLVLMYDGEFYNPSSIISEVPQNRRLTDNASAEGLVYLLKQYQGDFEQRITRALKDLDGNYALVVSSTDQTVVMRDPLGTKPLYIAKNGNFSAFASNKKALWSIGLSNVMPLRASMLAVFNQNGIEIKKAFLLSKSGIDIKDPGQAVNYYHEAICSSVRKRLTDVDKVGVLLSGGVDSCLIAKLVSDIASANGIKVTAYTAGLADSPDIILVKEFAKKVGLDYRVKVLSIDDVQKYIAKVIDTVEERDFVQIEAGIAIYAAVDMASQDGIKVIFSGQGADELWGGYSWYPDVLGKDGRQELSRRMWDDFTMADVETLDRENKIAKAHEVEMMFPYLDSKVVKLAMSVAPELKVTSKNDRVGKRPHRQLAQKIGVPVKYAYRNKEAAQHSSGIHNVLDIIAERNGFNANLVNKIGYASSKITTKKMGSSSRYGYRYARRSIWQIPEHVQLYLDTLAYNKGMLNELQRERIESFLEKI